MNKKCLDLYIQLYNISLNIKYTNDLKKVKELYEESLKIIEELIKLEEEVEADDEIDTKEMVVNEIIDNIGNYIDIDSEEIEIEGENENE